MSIKIMDQVWELDLRAPSVKLVLLAMADYSDHAGVCFPSAKRLAWKSGLSVRQTKAILSELRAAGILRQLSGPIGGRGNTSRYQICPEKGAKAAPFSAERVQFYPEKGCSPASKRVQPNVRKGANSCKNTQRILIEPLEPSGTVIEPSGAPAQSQPSLAFVGIHLRVTSRQDHILADAFPWVDRNAEYRKANSWLEANPDRRPKKFGRFTHNWFNKVPAPNQHGGKHEAVQRAHARTHAAADRFLTDIGRMAEETRPHSLAKPA